MMAAKSNTVAKLDFTLGESWRLARTREALQKFGEFLLYVPLLGQTLPFSKI
jgi:hypothetical protein